MSGSSRTSRMGGSSSPDQIMPQTNTSGSYMMVGPITRMLTSSVVVPFSTTLLRRTVNATDLGGSLLIRRMKSTIPMPTATRAMSPVSAPTPFQMGDASQRRASVIPGSMALSVEERAW